MRLSINCRPSPDLLAVLWKQKSEEISLKSAAKPVFTAAFERLARLALAATFTPRWDVFHKESQTSELVKVHHGGGRGGRDWWAVDKTDSVQLFLHLITLSKQMLLISSHFYYIIKELNPKCIWYFICAELVRWIHISGFWHLNSHTWIKARNSLLFFLNQLCNQETAQKECLSYPGAALFL